MYYNNPKARFYKYSQWYTLKKSYLTNSIQSPTAELLMKPGGGRGSCSGTFHPLRRSTSPVETRFCFHHCNCKLWPPTVHCLHTGVMSQPSRKMGKPVIHSTTALLRIFFRIRTGRPIKTILKGARIRNIFYLYEPLFWINFTTFKISSATLWYCLGSWVTTKTYINKDARNWDRTENKWERHSTATWLKGVTKVEQSTAILDIVQSGHGLTSFYRYY